MTSAQNTVTYSINKKTKYISFDPQVMGGNATIVGTRIPVQRVVYLLTQDYTMPLIATEFDVRESLLKKALIEYTLLVKSSSDDQVTSKV